MPQLNPNKLRFTPKKKNPSSDSSDENNFSYEVISTLESIGVHFRTSIDPGSYVPAHLHHAIEIIYLLEGNLTVTIESSIREYHAGECILINSDVIHSTKCTAPNKAILFQIPLSFLSYYLPNAEQLVFNLDNPNDNKIRRTKLDIFKNTLVQMQIVNDIRPEGFILRFNSLLFEILFQLFHNFSVRVVHSNQSQRNKDRARLDTILDYIAQNYRRHISIEEIAGIAYLQPGYFCRFFKKCMGITFLEYQNELRLSFIDQDIISTDDSIKDILERHGFTNYKLFRRTFFEHFEATPTEVRKMHDAKKKS